MILARKNYLRLIGGCLLLLMAAACVEKAPVQSTNVLMRAGNREVTVDAFLRSVEIAQSAYARSTLADPAVRRQIRCNVMNQTIEEMILLNVAEARGIRMTASEIDAAVTAVKADYPEGAFDDMLMETAISYPLWLQRLKTRLLTQKVVATVLDRHITVTQEDIAAYYGRYFSNGQTDIAKGPDGGIDDEKILTHLKREKAEKLYTDWLEKQKKQTTIVVNEKLWAEIIGAGGRIDAKKQACTAPADDMANTP